LIRAAAADVVLLALLFAVAVRFRARLRADWRELRNVGRASARRDGLKPVLYAALLTIGAAAIRIPFLTRPMGTDEAATFLYYASKPLTLGLTIYGSPNNHLLHTALMHAAWRTFGAHEWALRLPAMLFGVALVPLTWLAARALVRDGALVADALVAAAPVFVDYSTDGRGYTMLCAFTLVALVAILRVARDGNAAAMIVFALAVALGAYAVPAMLYPFAMLVAWRPRKPVLIAAALAAVLTLILYMPTIAVSGIASITSNAYVLPLPFARFAAAIPGALAAVWRSWMTGIPPILQLALAIGFIAGAVRRRVTLWLGATAVVAIVAAQRAIPFPRVWLPLAVLFMITAAAALPWGRWEPAMAAILFAGLATSALAIARLRETGELPQVEGIARELAARAAPGDAVAAAPPSDVPLAFYLDARVLRPDLAGSRRVYVVVNRAYGQSLVRTLAALRIDPRAFTIHPVRDYGVSAIYVLDRR
jgi:uncharacterized membrane protein